MIGVNPSKHNQAIDQHRIRTNDLLPILLVLSPYGLGCSHDGKVTLRGFAFFEELA
ncbi:hypothetical protein Q8W40_07115 [Vibrio penaeicida]|uniref:hypothetical protein n=1 Tax=Vibrio penaeicida TaxID=104609 RepID=UPI002734DDCC|nr:hypothetical protein [Vibrio penaeicida]MDP2571941.1 hypothetical protein [Vibrio penaeicida]